MKPQSERKTRKKNIHIMSCLALKRKVTAQTSRALGKLPRRNWFPFPFAKRQSKRPTALETQQSNTLSYLRNWRWPMGTRPLNILIFASLRFSPRVGRTSSLEVPHYKAEGNIYERIRYEKSHVFPQRTKQTIREIQQEVRSAYCKEKL